MGTQNANTLIETACSGPSEIYHDSIIHVQVHVHNESIQGK